MSFQQPFTGRTLSAIRVLFAVTLVAAFIVAMIPVPVSGTASQSDKVAHFAAFYGLGLFAAVAYPRTSLLLIGAMLSAFGGLIELVQGLDVVGRDRDVWDWVADTAGIAFGFGPMLMSGLRDRR